MPSTEPTEPGEPQSQPTPGEYANLNVSFLMRHESGRDHQTIFRDSAGNAVARGKGNPAVKTQEQWDALVGGKAAAEKYVPIYDTITGELVGYKAPGGRLALPPTANSPDGGTSYELRARSGGVVGDILDNNIVNQVADPFGWASGHAQEVMEDVDPLISESLRPYVERTVTGLVGGAFGSPLTIQQLDYDRAGGGQAGANAVMQGGTQHAANTLAYLTGAGALGSGPLAGALGPESAAGAGAGGAAAEGAAGAAGGAAAGGAGGTAGGTAAGGAAGEIAGGAAGGGGGTVLDTLTNSGFDWGQFWNGLGTLGGIFATARGADDMADAARYAADIQDRQYQQTREDLEPWRQIGIDALGRLNGLYGFGDQTGQPQQTSSEWLGMDPGYQFRLQEGENALARQQAAAGSRYSGNALRAASEYGQNFASNEFNNAYNRLAGLSGTGQVTTNQIANYGAQNATNQGNAMQNAANARASGYVGMANTLNQGIGQGYGIWQNNRLLSGMGY